jgi:carbamoyl-phosphate synthase large subunit
VIRILVTGAGALLGQGIIRALRNSSLDCTIIAVDPSPYAVGLYWADQADRVPMARSPEYLDVLERLLERERPDVLLVGTDTELPIISRHRQRLEDEYGCQVLVSDPRVIEIADDKWLTAEFLRSAGFPHPASSLPDQVEALLERVGFPLVVKPRRGARSVGVHRVETRGELDHAIAAVDDPVIQECVATDDEEYTAGVLVFPDSEVLSIVMQRHLRDGNTFRAFVKPFPELNAFVQRVAHTLAPWGPVNFQFRVDGQGIPKIFEINARFSGTTPLRARAGFNEVEMAVRYLLEGQRPQAPSVQQVCFLRYLDEVMVDLDAVDCGPATPAAPLSVAR